MDPFPSELLPWKKAFDKVIVDTLPVNRPDFDLDIKYDTTAPLPYSPVYNLSKKEEDHLVKITKERLAIGHIRPSSSPIASPVFFNEKKDGSLRECVDYRRANKLFVKDRYPLPLITSHLLKLGKARSFLKSTCARHLISSESSRVVSG